MPLHSSDDSGNERLIARIRQGEQTAWSECIARFEGRLLAYVDRRLQDRAQSEDLVQETFLGFLIGLPNYDSTETPLESFLFSIAAHKLTDYLRRTGRRPSLRVSLGSEQGSGTPEPPGKTRVASSLARSQERRRTDERMLAEGLRHLLDGWRGQGDFEKIKCAELLFVLGWQNKAVGERLGISEQAVANQKHFLIAKLKEWVKKTAHRELEPGEFGLP